MPGTYQEIRTALRNDPTSFPEIHTVAEMRPISQTIHLYQANREDFKALVEKKTPIGALKFQIETYMHEAMHWYDLVGTLWGVTFLDLIYLCLDIRESRPNTAEGEFHNIITLYDEERRILSPLYYHLVVDREREHSPEVPWHIGFTCGLEFDAYGFQNTERPIFFVRFLDHETKELIARQPMSVGALLETKAIASELHTGIEVLAASSETEDEFRTQLAIHNPDSGYLYNPALTIYTAPAHMLSYFVDTREAILTYDYAAALANVALNMTNEHFAALRHPNEFEEFGEDRLEAFRRCCDRGYAFAVLVRHGDRFNPEVALDQWLDTALQRAGLPPYAQFSEQTRNAILARARSQIESDDLFRARKDLESAGLDFFDALTARGTHWTTPSELAKHDLPVPYAFDRECNIFSMGKALHAEAFDPGVQFVREYHYVSYRDNFLTGARGVRIVGANVGKTQE